MKRARRATTRVLLEQGPDGWALITQRRLLRWFWRTGQRSLYAGLEDCLLVLSQAYLSASHKAQGVRLPRRQRKRFAQKIVAGLLGR